MEYLKRRRNEDWKVSDGIKRFKLQGDHLRNELFTSLEELSNEIFYEIFEYLEFHDVYKAFFRLNTRFANLLTTSTFPIQVNLSSISKSILQPYLIDVIEPNQHRVKLLRISHLLMYDPSLSLLSKLPQFSRLETLVLENVKSTFLQSILSQLSSLSFLSSLVINLFGSSLIKMNIYQQIMCLPALKYCKIPSGMSRNASSFPFATDQHSPIEHLVITNNIAADELDCLLSYVPQLRRLTLDSVHTTWSPKTSSYAPVLNYLTHFSLTLDDMFHHQESAIIARYCRTVEVLHISICSYSDAGRIDALQWQQLIESYMPKLRVFDIHFDIRTNQAFDMVTLKPLTIQYTSPFWITRQWSFACHSYQGTHINETGNRYHRRRYFDRRMYPTLSFCSINPYRRREYGLYKKLNYEISLFDTEENLKSVDHVRIQGDDDIIHCLKYFPNATKLTIESSFSSTDYSMATVLGHILPLDRLTTLTLLLEYNDKSFLEVIELLQFTSRLRTFSFGLNLLKGIDSMSIQQSEPFQFVSNTNNIRHLTVDNGYCTLEKVHFLVNLCPRLHHLEIHTNTKEFQSIIRFLLDHTNPNTRDLSALCFLNTTHIYSQIFDLLTEAKFICEDVMSKRINGRFYIWR